MTVTQCPSCGRKFKVSESIVGKQTKCPQCNTIFCIEEFGKHEEPWSASPSAHVSDPAAQASRPESGQRFANGSTPLKEQIQPFEPDPIEEYGVKADWPPKPSQQTTGSGDSSRMPTGTPVVTGSVFQRLKRAKSDNRNEYPALRRLSYVYRIGGKLSIVAAFIAGCLFVLCLWMAFHSGDKKAEEYIGLSLGLFFSSVINALICFAVSEILQWAIDMKSELHTATFLLAEMADRHG